MFCVGYGIYTRERSSQVYILFYNEHKTLYNLFSGIALTQLFPVLISHSGMYTLCSILLHYGQVASQLIGTRPK